jgi:hypothetical protein
MTRCHNLNDAGRRDRVGGMRNAWERFQSGRWWWRAPIKAAVLAVTVFVVCFPYPVRFARHVEHWTDPDAMIEPDAAGLHPMLADLVPDLAGVPRGPEQLRIVERFVYASIPFAWDWETWGVADYLPTVDEVLDKGREDCDGRAVVAASLLRNLGYDARLDTDTTHVWVTTDEGPTMSPGTMRPFMQSGSDGVRVRWGAVANVLPSLAYGIAVFPLERELIVLSVFWLLWLRRGMRITTVLVILLLLLDGLMLLRVGGKLGIHPLQAFACANLVVGVIILHVARRRTPMDLPMA